jgi:hypothetical protein
MKHVSLWCILNEIQRKYWITLCNCSVEKRCKIVDLYLYQFINSKFSEESKNTKNAFGKQCIRETRHNLLMNRFLLF